MTTTIRPLHIANKMRSLAEIKKITEDYGDANALEEGATEIERLYALLNEANARLKNALDVADKAVEVARA